MKKQIIITLVLSCILFTGCNFSKGANKDLRTGLSYTYNGFGVENVLLIDPANKTMTDNKVRLDSKVGIAAIGVTHYELKEGKAFPGMMLLVTDKGGKPVLNIPDLLKDNKGAPPADAAQMVGTITIAKPIVAGETLHVKMLIWDKIKPSNEINIETDLVVQ